MTRSEAVAAVERLIENLERDLSRAQTRDQHLSMSQRLAEARAIRAGLLTAPAAA